MNFNEIKGRIIEILERDLRIDAEIVSVFSISRNMQHAIGIYPMRAATPRQNFVGGDEMAGHEAIGLTLLVRWGRDGVAAHGKAAEIYNKLANYNDDKCFILATNDAPLWLGADERGVFEYTIDVEIYLNNFKEEFYENECFSS